MSKILPRKNELIRPAVTNIDQALVVFAVTEPKPHFNLLDRFLVMMESKEIPVVLCFNKKDIASQPELQRTAGDLQRLRIPGYIYQCFKRGEYRDCKGSASG